MPSKRYNAEEIIHKLREADVLLGQGQKSAGWLNSSVSASRHMTASAKPMAG